MNTENHVSSLMVVYQDKLSEVLFGGSDMIFRVATYASLERKDRLVGLTAGESDVVAALDADFAWVTALRGVRDQAIEDINAASNDDVAIAIIDAVVWPVR